MRFNVYITEILKDLAKREKQTKSKPSPAYSHKWFGILPFLLKFLRKQRKK